MFFGLTNTERNHNKNFKEKLECENRKSGWVYENKKAKMRSISNYKSLQNRSQKHLFTK